MKLFLYPDSGAHTAHNVFLMFLHTFVYIYLLFWHILTFLLTFMAAPPWLNCSVCSYGPQVNPLLVPCRHMASLSNVQESVWQQDNGLWSDSRPVPISLCLSLTTSVEMKSGNLFLMLWWMALPLSSISLILVVSLSHDWSKRPEDWEESIFVRHKECGYRLRDNIHFHMYISTSPCGDGRLNSPYEITSDRKTSSFLFLPFRGGQCWK